MHRRGERPSWNRSLGYDYAHTVIDDHSRLAYAEIHDDETGTNAVGVLERAITFYATVGARLERVISDNAFVRVGLRSALDLERGPSSRLASLVRLLQPRPSPSRLWKQDPYRPNQQRLI